LNTNNTFPAEDLTSLATGRSSSLFQEDLDNHFAEISEKTKGQRVLVLGGAGSIGSSTVKVLSEFDLACLHIVDQNENGLAEVVRDLRSRPQGLRIKDFRTLPIDFGSPVMRRYLKSERPYDLIFNFAALKHVRSEKDVCSVLQMFDTNLVKPVRCWQWLQEGGSNPSYFSVSTDKAAEPVNLMGASKRIMEHFMFCGKSPMSSAKRITSSRFANVAFSNGSLLESFIQRFEKQQPIAAPSDTRRFFISLEEAGQICALAAICGPDRHIMIPRLDPQDDDRKLEEIAAAFLRYKGFEPHIYRDEQSARQSVAADRAHNRYPLLLTPLDTVGEKTCEKFVAENEEVIECGMAGIIAVGYLPVAPETLADFLKRVENFVSNPESVVNKQEILEAVSQLVPEFEHAESSQILDQRM
jgi:FlaA1/EpsC-like NDP-sugar epimerase